MEPRGPATSPGSAANVQFDLPRAPQSDRPDGPPRRRDGTPGQANGRRASQAVGQERTLGGHRIALRGRHVAGGCEVPATLAEVEAQHIVRVLTRAKGNKQLTARLLGISRQTLSRKLDRLSRRDTGVPASLAELEAAHVRDVLAMAGGNKKLAAALLGISRQALYDCLTRQQAIGRDSAGCGGR